MQKSQRSKKYKRFLIDYSQNFDMRDDYKRFFRKDNFDDNYNEIFDKTLYEFPVFGMNETYLKALGNIISIKLRLLCKTKKRTLDILDKVLADQNRRENVLRNEALRSDLIDIEGSDTLERAKTREMSQNPGLNELQRLEAQRRMMNLRKQKYETNLDKFEEAFPDQPSNTEELNIGQNKFLEQQRNMSK